MKKIISISIALAIISSCTTSNQVVSSKMFQKRKYQKGWHINNSKKLDKSTEVNKNEAVAQNEDYEGVVIEENQETQVVSAEENLNSNSSSGVEWYFWVLALFIPWLAVGIVTNWDVETVVINILWTLLCGIPGIIHAFIILNREG